MTNTNKIISFNCDCKWSNLEGILKYITDNQIIVSCLQDVPKKTINKPYATHENLKCIASNNLTIIYLDNKATPDMQTLKIAQSTNIEYMLLRFGLKSINSPLNICNIYIRPKTPACELIKLLNKLKTDIKTLGASRTIILGDFNSISSDWCPPDITINLRDYRTHNENKSYLNLHITRGRLIKNFFEKNKLSCINDTKKGHTAYNKNTKTYAYIDLAIIGNKCLRTWTNMKINSIKTTGNKIHGHKIIMIEQNRTQPKPIHPKTTHPKANHANKQRIKKLTTMEKQKRLDILKKAFSNVKYDQDWINKDKTTQIRLMNDLAECVYEYLGHVQKTNRTTYKRRNKKSNRKTNLLSMRKIANKIKNGPRTPKKMDKARLTRWIQKEAEKMMNINSKKAEIWHKLDLDSELFIEDEPDLNIDESNIDRVMLEKFPQIQRPEASKLIKNDPSTQDDDIAKIPLQWEIDNALYQIRNKKHTGQEGIKFTTFNQQLDTIKTMLTDICKISKYTSHIPENCKTTLGKIIPKKKKGQFRIVHLATPLLCLIEQITLHQLEYQIERHKKLDRRQYGFTPLRDRHDLVTRIIETTMINKMKTSNKGLTTIISLDIKGAFDNIDHDHIVKKLYDTFGHQSNISKWLAQFLLDKKIILEYKKTRSSPANICKGVPQGSCLGPILWNFAIEDITTELNETAKDKYEILTYADDIIITIQNGSRNEKQNILNTLENKLKTIKLEIDPSKCAVMSTKMRNTDNDNNSDILYIGGEQIEIVKSMTILGINIKNNMKLDLDAVSKNDKLRLNIHKIERLNSLGIISNRKDWDIVINSYIRSILIGNNFPILAIDKCARRQINTYMTKILRHIFNWPQNTSQKLIKTIMKEYSVKLQVKKLIYKKLHQEESTGYQTLMNILEYGQFLIENIKSSAKIYRRIADPETHIDISELQNNDNIDGMCYIIESNSVSILSVFNGNGTVKHIEAVSHNQYRIGYFNTMALITNKIIQTEHKEIHCEDIGHKKTIIISKSNSLIQAIQKMTNHDQRIIAIRERMCSNGWLIKTINKGTNQLLHNTVTNYIKNTTNNISIMNLNRPDVNDYATKNRCSKEIANQETIEMLTELTSFCKLICYDSEIWSKLNPSWLSGKRMLLLSGLVNNHDGCLIHFSKLEHKCECNSLEDRFNWVLHKALDCRENELETRNPRIIELIKQYRASDNKKLFIKQTLQDRFKQQTLLKVLCEAAFKLETR